MDVTWLEDAQLIFAVFHTFVCNFFSCDPPLPSQIYRRIKESRKTSVTDVGKINAG